MLRWRSPLGTMGLCILTNLRAQQESARGSWATIGSGRLALLTGRVQLAR